MCYIQENKVKKWVFKNEIFKGGKIFINFINEINERNEIYKKEMNNTEFYDELLDIFLLKNDIDKFVNNINNSDIEYYLFLYGITKVLNEYKAENGYIDNCLKNIFNFLLTSNIYKSYITPFNISNAYIYN
jgi:hypothetical protein